jgi:hypothetical protein
MRCARGVGSRSARRRHAGEGWTRVHAPELNWWAAVRGGREGAEQRLDGTSERRADAELGGRELGVAGKRRDLLLAQRRERRIVQRALCAVVSVLSHGGDVVHRLTVAHEEEGGGLRCIGMRSVLDIVLPRRGRDHARRIREPRLFLGLPWNVSSFLLQAALRHGSRLDQRGWHEAALGVGRIDSRLVPLHERRGWRRWQSSLGWDGRLRDGRRRRC